MLFRVFINLKKVLLNKCGTLFHVEQTEEMVFLKKTKIFRIVHD